MPTSNTRDVARAIARLRDDIRDLQDGNQPDEELAVTRDETETTESDDTVTEVLDPSGNDRYLHYGSLDSAQNLQNNTTDDVAVDIPFGECDK